MLFLAVGRKVSAMPLASLRMVLSSFALLHFAAILSRLPHQFVAPVD